MKRIAAVALLALVATTAVAAQFGLDSGESLAQVRKVASLKSVAPYLYSTSTVPNGNVAFEEYRLFITPDQGLCKIIAWTPDISSSVYGDEVMEKFSGLFAALSNKYGETKKYDFLRGGSIWNEPKDWMMGLAEKERILFAGWDTKNGAKLPSDVAGISLEAHGVNSSHALISLSYEFTNFASCRAWVKAQENSSL